MAFALGAAGLWPAALAQSPVLVARAASVSGHVMLSSASTPSLTLTPGYPLNPGDRLDTRGGGQVVVDLSDGSVIIVQAETVLVIKDFRAALSIRELFEIAVGAVRVRINHFAGRPNPYRMNSPTASIAVRGTEFSVEVDSESSTQVVVFEGAVEVSSLADPGLTALVEAGRGVLVSPRQSLRMFPAPAARDGEGRERETGEPRGRAGNDGPPRGDAGRTPMRPDNGPQRGDSGPPMGHAEPGPELARGDHPAVRHDHNESPAHAGLSSYDRYIAGLTDAGQVPFVNRFSAIPDAQLDSLENPAYAAGFRAAEGRVLLLPAFGGQTGLEKNTAVLGPAGWLPADYSISPQFSVFAPLPGGHFVIGGAAVASRLEGALSTSNFLTGSLLAAVRLGAEGKNSFGLKLDRVGGSGARAGLDSAVFQTRWTAGFAREFAAAQTLEVFVSYSSVGGNQNQLSYNSSGHTLEAGFRLRGTLTPRLLYGITGSWVGLSSRDTRLGVGAAASGQHDGAQRGSLAMGLGYVLNRRTVLSLDVAGAVSGNRATRLDTTTGWLLESASASERFLSLHGAVQADITRRLFGTASLLVLAQSHRFGSMLFPERFGNFIPAPELSFALASAAYPMATHFSDFGIGWRFSDDFFVQYVYSTSYGYNAASHAVMLRYAIHFHRQ